MKVLKIISCFPHSTLEELNKNSVRYFKEVLRYICQYVIPSLRYLEEEHCMKLATRIS